MSLRDYMDACYAQAVNEEMAAEGYTAAYAMKVIDERLLPPEERDAIQAERKARENLEATMQMGVPIVGLPPGVSLSI